MSQSPDKSSWTIQAWADRIIEGDLRAIARALSACENQASEAPILLAALRANASEKRSIVLGITGPAGSGKSTLTNALIEELRKDGTTVAVLAVDPSSPLSGGALLGDRIRMQAHGLDTGVLIRSMATRGALGGIAKATRDAVTMLEAAGKDYIIIETVGVGQDEIAVTRIADITLLVLTPGSGDEVQAMKSGIMELADIIVLNKADHPSIDQLESDIRENLHDATPEKPAIIKTVATDGRGVPQLRVAIDALARHVRSQPHGRGGPQQQADGIELDHLGIAVGSVAEALSFYEKALGLQVSGTYDIPHELTHVAMLPAGDARIELLEATQAESPIGRFVARRGPGLHHVCLRVPDLARAVASLKAAGVRLINEAPQIGAGGHRYIFVHPSSAGGVLLELVEGKDHA